MTEPSPRVLPVALLFAMIFASQLASTIFIPALPDIADDLGTSYSAVQILIPVFLAAFAVAQLVAGPLSDRFGRRPVVIAGLGLFAVSSFGGYLATDVETLMIARFAQGAGACTTIAVGRAIIRDTSEGVAAVQAMSWLAIAMGSGPAVAPLIGGLLTTFAHWRTTFLLTAVIGSLVFSWVVLRLRETLPPAERHPPRASQLALAYLRILRNSAFLGYSLIVSFASGAMMAFQAAAPIVLITLMGLPAAWFGFYLTLMPSLFVVATFTSRRLTTVMPVDRVILIGGVLSATGGLLQLVFGLYGVTTHYPVLGAFAIANFGTGLVFANCYAQALSTVTPSVAGSASAMSGFLHMGWGFLVSFALASVSHTSSLQLGIGQFITTWLALGTAVLLILVVNPRRLSRELRRVK